MPRPPEAEAGPSDPPRTPPRTTPAARPARRPPRAPDAPPAALPWLALAAPGAAALGLAALNPWLAYRDAPYILGGFAGILAFALMPAQPLLAAPRLRAFRMAPRAARRRHAWLGGAILLCTLLHVAGLYVTSPEDTLDVLLLRAPTPFSVWGAIALWALLGAGALGLRRRGGGMGAGAMRLLHAALGALAALATILHAVQIEGAMETVTKFTLALAVAAATPAGLSALRGR